MSAVVTSGFWGRQLYLLSVLMRSHVDVVLNVDHMSPIVGTFPFKNTYVIKPEKTWQINISF